MTLKNIGTKCYLHYLQGLKGAKRWWQPKKDMLVLELGSVEAIACIRFKEKFCH
jgi:hypothetical protein